MCYLCFNYLRIRTHNRRSTQKFYYKLQPGITGKLLPDRYRRQFAMKQITCIEYQDISQDEERDIFQVRCLFYPILSPNNLYSVFNSELH